MKRRLITAAMLAVLAALAFSLLRPRGGNEQDPQVIIDLRSPDHRVVDLSKLEYPELRREMDLVSAGLYIKTGDTAAPLSRLGSGFLAHDKILDRFFIVTAAHVLEGTDLSRSIAAIHVRDNATKVEIWLVDAQMVDFATPDIKHDVAVCDITDAVKQLVAKGLYPICIEMSALSAGYYDKDLCDYCALNIYWEFSGCASMTQVEPYTGTRAICLEITDQTNGTFTTFHKDGVLIEKSVWKDFAIGDKPVYLGGRQMYIEVHEIMGDLTHGDSGSPVFGKDSDGNIRLIGIVAGGGDGQKCYIVPAKYVHGAIYPALAELDARIITDDSLLVKAAEYESTIANGVVSTPIECNLPLVRKAVLTFEGDCTEGNGFTVNLLNSKAPVPEDEDIVRGLLLGWNNTDTVKYPPAAPGRKRHVITFWLDKRGRCRKAAFSDLDGVDGKDLVEERTAEQYSSQWDKMILSAYGEPSPNGKVKLELYATKQRSIEDL